MNKIFCLIFIIITVVFVGCNSYQTSTSFDQKNNGNSVEQSTTSVETNNIIVPKSNNLNFIANTPKTGQNYVKTDITINAHTGGFSMFDSSKIIVRTWYDLTCSESVYNTDGTLFIDGDIFNNKFSNMPSTLTISRVYGNYTIIESNQVEQNDSGSYFTPLEAEKHIFLYNINNEEKKEIKDVNYAKLQDDYIITDKGIFDTKLNVILAKNSAYDYIEIANNEIIIAKNINTMKFGLLDLDGKIVADFNYNSIHSFNGGNLGDTNNFVEYTVATKPYIDKNGDEFSEPVIIDLRGNEIETQFTMDHSIIDNSRFISQYNGNTYFTFCKGSTEYIKGASLLPISKTQKYLILNQNGETVFDNFNAASGFINGYNIIKSRETMKSKLVNLEGETIYEINIYETAKDGESYMSIPDSYGFFVVDENGQNIIYDLAKNVVYSSDNNITSVGNGFFIENNTLFSITKQDQ